MDLTERILDLSHSPLVVAEMSGNNGGSLQKALDLVQKAHECGADALKLQTYKPDTITVNGTCPRFKIQSGLWKGRTLVDLYQEAMTPWDWHAEIAQKARSLGMYCFSSPFDETAVDFLEKVLSPSVYKIASFELNHFPLLKKIGKLGKTVIASVGVSNDRDIKEALDVLRSNGTKDIILLHCVSEYPAEPKDFCLKKMPDLGRKHHVSFGLSDHSAGHLIATAATALGARVIEKHFCLDRERSTIDGGFSMLPEEFSAMVQAVRETFLALSGESLPTKPIFYKRSILVSEKIRDGDLLNEHNLRVARPGDGLCPSNWEFVLGKKAAKNMEVGHPLSEGDFF